MDSETKWDDDSDLSDESREKMYDGSTHIIPVTKGERLHLSHWSCWCEPELLVDANEENGQIYVHRVMH